MVRPVRIYYKLLANESNLSGPRITFIDLTSDLVRLTIIQAAGCLSSAGFADLCFSKRRYILLFKYCSYLY